MRRTSILSASCPWLVPAVFAVLVGAGPSSAAGDAKASVEAVEAVLDADKVLLEQDLNRFRSLSRRRTEAVTEIELLHKSLEDALGDSESIDPFRLERILDQVQRMQKQRDALLIAERTIVDRIADRLRRMALLEQRIADFELRPPPASEGLLSGSWSLSLMPIGQRGTVDLEQSGAVVDGTYELDGGWTGSLQGTLVNRKVFLIRIDSKLGKSMELEGFVSADGNSIRGTWLNYELAGSQGANGEWSARRRVADEP